MNRKNGMLVIIFFAVVGITLVSGCAASYRCEPHTWFHGGYTDAHIKGNLYYVTFEGNTRTTDTDAIKCFHQRAKELCEQNGYKDYAIKDKKDASTQMLVGQYGYGHVSASTMNFPGFSGYVECIK